MLHIGLLPNHDRWGDVLANLRYVVVDEAHVYRGVFGSHVGNVLRRLRRLARIYGAEPQFLLASATISNPGELGRELLGLPVTVIGDDAAPRAERTVVLWNPPLRRRRARPARIGARRGGEAPGRASSSAACGRSPSRRAGRRPSSSTASPPSGSATTRASRPTAPATRRSSGARSSGGSPRASCSASRRRTRSSSGSTSASSTRSSRSASPGTVASLRQQWGRAGRRGHGLAVLVATEDALDQYFMREPDKLLGRRVEAAILDHANPRVLAGHVRAAAYEAPIDDARRGDPRRGGARGRRGRPGAEATPRGIVWAGKDSPAARVPLRSADPDAFTVVDASSGSVLGLVERSRAYSTVHEGAVYLHLGESYLVRELDERRRCARSSSRSAATGTRRRSGRPRRRSSGRCARSAGSGSSSSSARSR